MINCNKLIIKLFKIYIILIIEFNALKDLNIQHFLKNRVLRVSFILRMIFSEDRGLGLSKINIF